MGPPVAANHPESAPMNTNMTTLTSPDLVAALAALERQLASVAEIRG